MDRHRLVCSALAVLWLLQGAISAGETLLLVDGRWFDGQSFRKNRFFSVDGVLRSDAPGRVDRRIDLDGAFVVPAYGEAHNHNVADAEGFEVVVRRYLREGVFYVKTMSNLPRLTEPIRSRLNRPDSLDVVFANGGLTATGGHPIRLREQLLERGAYPGFTKESLRDHGYYIIDQPADLESKWESILVDRPDFIKAFLLRSEEFEKRRDDPGYFGRKGLDPEILRLIVKRAHAEDLRVSVHVETGTDFHHAIAAGADEIAHLPGYARAPQTIRPEDAALAAERVVVVITTASLARQQSSDSELYESIRSAQRANLHLLHEQGVQIAIGSDNFLTTSVSEAMYLDELGVFNRATLLRMLCETTPRSIFPGREIGVLAAGQEATFLALAGDPLEDFGNIRKIRLRVKQGQVLVP